MLITCVAFASASSRAKTPHSPTPSWWVWNMIRMASSCSTSNTYEATRRIKADASQSRSSRLRLMRSAAKDRRREWPAAMITFRSRAGCKIDALNVFWLIQLLRPFGSGVQLFQAFGLGSQLFQAFGSGSRLFQFFASGSQLFQPFGSGSGSAIFVVPPCHGSEIDWM